MGLIIGIGNNRGGALVKPIIVDTLPTASADTMNKVYLVPSNSDTDMFDVYYTVESGGSYSWEQDGTVSREGFEIADNLTTNDATKALSAKQGKVLADAGAATAAEVTALGHEVDEIRSDVDGQNQEIADFKETITNQIENFQPIVIEGDVVNAPDEEDITTDENDLLKFANRGTLHGMGYVILRRGNTFAEQVTLANTIYEIRYDFDLGGASVTIPSGCVLRFNGGSINNGTLSFNDTQIEGNYSFSGIVAVSGGIYVDKLYLERFTFTTDVEELRFAIECFASGIVTILRPKTYSLTKDNLRNISLSGLSVDATWAFAVIQGKNNLCLFGNDTIIKVPATQTTTTNYALLCLYDCANVTISGITFDGDFNFAQQSTYTFGFVPVVAGGACSALSFDYKAVKLNVPFIYGSYSGTTDERGLFDSVINIQSELIRYGVEIHGATQSIFNIYCIGGHRGGYYDMLKQCAINFIGKNFTTAVGVLIQSGILASSIDPDQVLRGCDNVKIDYIELGSDWGVITGGKPEVSRVQLSSYDENTQGWSQRNYSVVHSNIYVNYNINLTSKNYNSLARIFTIGNYQTSLSPYDIISGTLRLNIFSADYTSFVLPRFWQFTAQADIDVYVKSNIAYSIGLLSTDNKNIHYHLDGKRLDISNAVSAAFSQFVVSNSNTCRHRFSILSGIYTDTIDNSNLFSRIDVDGCGKLLNARTVDLGVVAEMPCVIDSGVPTKCALIGYRIYCNALNQIIYWNGSRWGNNDGAKIGSGVTSYYGSTASRNAITSHLDATASGYKYYDTDLKKFVVWNGYSGQWTDMDGTSLVKSGASADRPTTLKPTGFIYFDTTLGKPIVWNGTAWVNMDGTAL